MGYSKLSYDDMVEHPEIWRIEKELVSPAWAEEISELGYKGVWAVDFYNDVFGEHLEPSRMPEDYQTHFDSISIFLLVPPSQQLLRPQQQYLLHAYRAYNLVEHNLCLLRNPFRKK